MGQVLGYAVEMSVEITSSKKLNQRITREEAGSAAFVAAPFRPKDIIGNSKPMKLVYELIEKVLYSDATVLILGESGVGKELVAAEIHHQGQRKDGPFIKVNCSALPLDIVESELFGHEKGAFTGALGQRKGRFELAEKGTIFLDEIGDLPLSVQVKLLRILQEREYERIGGGKTIQCDVRIIAATNRNLESMVKAGSFREDLFYRLNVFPINIPSLRKRKKDDILLLTDHFIQLYSKSSPKKVKRISTEAIEMLVSYHWPGNVRELSNCIERAVLMTNDSTIQAYHLPPTLQTAESSKTTFKGTLQEKLEKVEKSFILDTLKNTRGNLAKAAKILGITERIMGLRVKKYKIDPKIYRL